MTELGLSDVAVLLIWNFFSVEFWKSLLFFVVNTSEDGWWEAENAAGKQGVVPRTLLKVDRNKLVCIIFM